MRYFFVCIVLGIFACNNNPASEETTEDISTIDSTELVEVKDAVIEEPVHPHQDFLDFYRAFISALQQSSTGEPILDEYIHPTHGFYIISNLNGAMPELHHFSSVQGLDENKALRDFLYGYCTEIEKKPVFEPFPKVICEENQPYERIGCFASDSSNLAESAIWNYTNTNDKEKQAVQFAAESVEIVVLNTFFFTCYFSKVEDEYKVTFIDIRTPCEA